VQTDLTRERRRIANMSLAVMGGTAAVMLFTIILAIAGVQIVLLSWVLLTAAIIFLVASILVFRASLDANRAQEHERPNT
jgi:hypothetical protein